MKSILSLLLIIALVSCQTQATSTPEKTTGSPNKEFIEFAQELNKKEIFADTSRVRKKGLYSLNDFHMFDKNPFYYLEYSETQISKVVLATTPDALSKVESVWAYYHREKKNSDNMVADGVIEQWTFSDNAQAKKVFDHLKEKGESYFFNTTPYFCIKDKTVYIFHTRAMAFSFSQKTIFEDFQKKL